MDESSSLAEPLQQVGRTYVRWRGRKLTYFGGCDYFRLSSHREIARAVTEGLRKYGLNVAASRRTTGNHHLYDSVEAATVEFFQCERAVLVSNGYMTNIAAAQALRGTLSHVLIDEGAHPSLKDAAIFLNGKTITFRHRDPVDLKRKVAKIAKADGVALLTDGLFANDGSFAPLQIYRDVIGGEALLWVDDSHAGGVIGKHGRGTIEAAGLDRKNVLQTITFSKAFGVYGGAVLCHNDTAHKIYELGTAVTGNTPLPLPLANAVLTALSLVGANPDMRVRLRRNVALFWSTFGVKVAEPLAPIVSLVPADPEALRKKMLHEGIYPSIINYHGGPSQGYLRCAISSEHSPAQLRALAKILSDTEVIA